MLFDGSASKQTPNGSVQPHPYIQPFSTGEPQLLQVTNTLQSA